MRALEVSPGDPDRAVLRAFLAEHADPIDDLLAYADVDLPLARLATAWVLEEGGEAVAVAFSFPLWPSTPALGVKGRTPADERSALAKLVAIGSQITQPDIFPDLINQLIIDFTTHFKNFAVQMQHF